MVAASADYDLKVSLARRRTLHAASGPLLKGLLLTVAFLAAAVPQAFARDKPLEAKLSRLDGGKVRLSEFRGGPVLLDLWASWCLPCHEQSTILESLAEEIEAAGAHAYAVNMGEEAEVVRQHLERRPAEFPVLLDRWQIISTKLGIGELPALILLDADGNVVAKQVGLARREAVLELLAQLPPGSG